MRRTSAILRWLNLLCVVLPLGATFAHVYELPNKLRLDGPLWLAVQQNLYRGWGPFIGPFEIGALVTAAALAVVRRNAPAALAPTVVATICLAGMLAAFFAFNAPVNAAFARWTPETLPPDWPRYRLRWEFGHALAFVLAVAALVFLIGAMVAERRGRIVTRAGSGLGP